MTEPSPERFLVGLGVLTLLADWAAHLLRRALTGLENTETSVDMRVARPPIVPLMAGIELLDEHVAFETGRSYA